ncbi:MAG: hypothetical protein CHACPFDD_01089 [Phycisphaerae bacterium]|nr:hypothetical protein [Phycisphaerae bacterium]
MRLRSILATVALAAICSECAVAFQMVRYHVRLLPDLPGGHTGAMAVAVNNLGWVCGDGNKEDYSDEPVIWYPDGSMLRLGELSDAFGDTHPEGMNAHGHVSGVSNNASGDTEAFLWTPESGMIGLGDLPGGNFYSWAHGINDHDEVVGVGRNEDGQAGFFWRSDLGMVYIGDLPGGSINSNAKAINNHSQVTGYSVSARTALGEGFIWDPLNGMRDLGTMPGGGFMREGYAINDLGQIAGACVTSTGQHGCLWDPVDGFTVITRPPGTRWSRALGMNDVGQVVGQWETDELPPSHEGWIWDRENGLRALTPLLGARKPPYLGDVVSPRDINNRGQIVCIIDGTGEGVLLTPFVVGDLNCDASVDVFDVEPFVLALVDLEAHAAAYPDCYGDWAGDINQDGSFNGFDVDAFVELLAGP